ncbi:hypothetical protein CN887_02375 [Bacillus pseudomycoides]|uniref:hypothetical protein n=1 Tax=Bacillus pseudomycoides TaxID=64104 RepID=UPI000BECED62|nr:hypothetical protein [Bacillus pseudomycoides]PEF21472.1 hypothetical protein CON69_27855 [Bacillus pseudomycoides]PEJ28281.1 hypothetical protein CN887_02375 [Bacillus pseudomycoides]PGD78944.1 hypothetical protein COM46_04535 [Bacillus pseudomycoides]PHG37773.1 hypothetical protein COI43_00920 [Bacillus pseudomycoides]
MKPAFSVTDSTHIQKIEAEGLKLLNELQSFIPLLQEKVTILSPPKGIVFHDLESATQVYSNIPMPAYTSRDLIHITPLIDVWKNIYLSVTDGKELEKAQQYYKQLNILDIATIAAHEFVHHAEEFHSDFDAIDEESMWFEEGVCFYLSRKLMMSHEQFKTIMQVEDELISIYQAEFSNYPLNEFGKSAESGSYAGAFYDYWRSTKLIRILVEQYFNNDIQALFSCYHEWVEIKEQISLHAFFVQKLSLSPLHAKELGLLS